MSQVLQYPNTWATHLETAYIPSQLSALLWDPAKLRPLSYGSDGSLPAESKVQRFHALPAVNAAIKECLGVGQAEANTMGTTKQRHVAEAAGLKCPTWPFSRLKQLPQVSRSESSLC